MIVVTSNLVYNLAFLLQHFIDTVSELSTQYWKNDSAQKCFLFYYFVCTKLKIFSVKTYLKILKSGKYHLM